MIYAVFTIRNVYKSNLLRIIKVLYIILIVALFYIYYFIGYAYFADQVKRHCRHGNCKHGWYGKNNDKQKVYAFVYVIASSIGISICYIRLNEIIIRSDENLSIDWLFVIKY